MKRLTVIVPIYNALDDVKICLKSLLENFNFDLGRVFLINDYSDDITSEFLKINSDLIQTNSQLI